MFTKRSLSEQKTISPIGLELTQELNNYTGTGSQKSSLLCYNILGDVRSHKRDRIELPQQVLKGF